MNIFLENVSIKSNSGPNHFARKLKKYLKKYGHTFEGRQKKFDLQLTFIESTAYYRGIPRVQRLDGIYFDPTNNYVNKNRFISDTYKATDGVIFQSQYSKSLVEHYLGKHKKSIIIPNGADIELIDTIKPLENDFISRYKNIWCCASAWRPVKRLSENIRYFLEVSEKDDCLLIAGSNISNEEAALIESERRVYYIGQLDIEELYSLFKASKHFIHLAWVDPCPNVVIDARACGCHIIGASMAGTKEIAGLGATIVQEEQWDFNPVSVNHPPELNFNNQYQNDVESDLSMMDVAAAYSDFLKGCKEEYIYEHKNKKNR